MASRIIRTAPKIPVSSFSLNQITTTLRTFTIGYCHISVLLNSLHIANMVFSTAFGCNICRRYFTHNPLNIFWRYTRCPIRLDDRTQVAPIYHYMVRCGYIQICTICKYHNGDNGKIADIFQYRFDGSCVSRILSNRISQLMLFA